MKIAQVVSTPPMAWGTGGVARVVYDLSKELVKRGHEVTILTTDLYKPNKRYFTADGYEYIDGIKIIRFKNISNQLAWKHKLFISVGLINYLRVHLHEYDIIHLQDIISTQAIATSKSCKKNDVPYIISTHGSIPWLNQDKKINKVFKKLWGYEILKHANKITVLNQYEAEQCKYKGINKDNIKVVYNYIDPDEYRNLPQKMEFKKKYSIKKETQMILYVGRLEKSKGLDLLINAFAELSKDLDDIILVIVGVLLIVTEK